MLDKAPSHSDQQLPSLLKAKPAFNSQPFSLGWFLLLFLLLSLHKNQPVTSPGFDLDDSSSEVVIGVDVRSEQQTPLEAGNPVNFMICG